MDIKSFSVPKEMSLEVNLTKKMDRSILFKIIPPEILCIIYSYFSYFELWRCRGISREYKGFVERIMQDRLLYGPYRLRIFILHVQEPILLKCTRILSPSIGSRIFEFEPISDSSFHYSLSYVYGPPSFNLYVRKCQWVEHYNDPVEMDPFLDFQLNIGGDLILKTVAHPDGSCSSIRLQYIVNYTLTANPILDSVSRYHINGKFGNIQCSDSFLLQLMRKSCNMPFKHCEPIPIYNIPKFELLKRFGKSLGFHRISLTWLHGVVLQSSMCPLRSKLVKDGFIQSPQSDSSIEWSSHSQNIKDTQVLRSFQGSIHRDILKWLAEQDDTLSIRNSLSMVNSLSPRKSYAEMINEALQFTNSNRIHLSQIKAYIYSNFDVGSKADSYIKRELDKKVRQGKLMLDEIKSDVFILSSQ